MSHKFSIVSLNISDKKGIIKTPGNQVEVTDTGIAGDAHSGSWHRQISLLGTESIKKQEERLNRELKFGEFAENITTEGFMLYHAKPLDRIVSGDVVLEVTQIGKKCHNEGCAIKQETGDCVMPSEGIFCRVVSGGRLHVNDLMEYVPKTFKLKVITLSDRAHAGVYKDRSGEIIVNTLGEWFAENGFIFKTEKVIIPDDKEIFTNELKNSVEASYDLIISTGSTGLGSRDIAPSIIKEHLEMELPGIMELIRIKYGADNPRALLSRSVAGVIGKTIVYGLPGSTKAVNEYLSEILKTLKHSVLMLHDIDAH